MFTLSKRMTKWYPTRVTKWIQERIDLGEPAITIFLLYFPLSHPLDERILVYNKEITSF